MNGSFSLSHTDFYIPQGKLCQSLSRQQKVPQTSSEAEKELPVVLKCNFMNQRRVMRAGRNSTVLSANVMKGQILSCKTNIIIRSACKCKSVIFGFSFFFFFLFFLPDTGQYTRYLKISFSESEQSVRSPLSIFDDDLH